MSGIYTCIEWTCTECGESYIRDVSGDADERSCYKCLDIEEVFVPHESKGEQRDPDIRRSSTVHYPDWNMKKKKYIIPPRQRKEDK